MLPVHQLCLNEKRKKRWLSFIDVGDEIGGLREFGTFGILIEVFVWRI